MPRQRTEASSVFLEACVSDLSFAVLLDDLGCRRIAGFKLLLVEA
jgi:hypothetical protein